MGGSTLQWRIMVRTLLLEKGWTEYSDNTPCPADVSKGVYIIIAKSICGNAVETTIDVPEGDGVGAWKMMEEKYQSNRPTRKYQLLRSVPTQRCDDGDVPGWIQKKENYCAELERIGITIENVLMSSIMNWLPEEYAAVADRTELPNVTALKHTVLDKHDRLNAHAEEGMMDLPMANTISAEDAWPRQASGSTKWKDKGKGNGGRKTGCE